MIRFFYFLYNINATSKSFFGIYSAKVIRKLTSILYTVILPIYFCIIRLFILPNLKKGENNIIITLTSFPARINKVYQVIISLMIQSSKVSEIILYLSKKQFSSIDDVPKSLTNLIPFGLKIIFVENDLRSYKKYIYNKELFENKEFVIVDDDIIYHPDTISFLLNTGKKYPELVCANRCVVMNKEKKYKYWKLAEKEGVENYMATGCGGVYYPINSLHDIAYNKELAIATCPDGDDIWLNAATKLSKSKVVFTGFSKLLLPIQNNNANNLHVENIQGNRNDINIANVNNFLMKSFKRKLFDE